MTQVSGEPVFQGNELFQNLTLFASRINEMQVYHACITIVAEVIVSEEDVFVEVLLKGNIPYFNNITNFVWQKRVQEEEIALETARIQVVELVRQNNLEIDHQQVGPLFGEVEFNQDARVLLSVLNSKRAQVNQMLLNNKAVIFRIKA